MVRSRWVGELQHPSRAEYMRAYRAHKKAAYPSLERQAKEEAEFEAADHTKDHRIAELEAEVKHLKAELAKRPDEVRAAVNAERSHLNRAPLPLDYPLPRPEGSFNSRPFVPAPKKGK